MNKNKPLKVIEGEVFVRHCLFPKEWIICEQNKNKNNKKKKSERWMDNFRQLRGVEKYVVPRIYY